MKLRAAVEPGAVPGDHLRYLVQASLDGTDGLMICNQRAEEVEAAIPRRLIDVDQTHPSTLLKCDMNSHFSSRDSTRSASGLPPVWQVGQYWNVESWKMT
jgi:hypothetical protein